MLKMISQPFKGIIGEEIHSLNRVPRNIIYGLSMLKKKQLEKRISLMPGKIQS